MLLLMACSDDGAPPAGAKGGGGDEGGLETGPETGLEGESGETGGGGTGETGGAAFDALALAGQVSEDELATTIAALAALGTRYTYTDGDEQAAVWIAERFEELGYVPESRMFNAKKGEEAANVLAVLEGATAPERVWVFQAHYDSTSNAPESDAPGADDNASGVAAVLEAARILSACELADTVWFVATGAEEQGSLGSAALVEEVAAAGVQVQGVIAPDMIGYWPAEDGDAFDILGDADSAHLVSGMSSIAEALGVANKTWEHHDYCQGDDHTSWQDGGYPAISPMDCVEAHNEPQSGEDTPNYHRTTDTIDTLYLPFTAKVTGVIVASLASWASG
jgi:hypothetical protein